MLKCDAAALPVVIRQRSQHVIPAWLTIPIAILCAACQAAPAPLGRAERAAVEDSVRTIVTSVFDAATHLDAHAFVQRYAQDSAIIVDNGATYTPQTYVPAGEAVYKAISALQSKPSAIHIAVLGADAAAAIAPFRWTITSKTGTSVSGDGVWSGVLERRNGTWAIISSHESETNLAALAAAMTPPAPAPSKREPAGHR